MASKRAQAYISSVMHETKDEAKPHKQRVAIALSKARKRGFKLPPRPKEASNG